MRPVVHYDDISLPHAGVFEPNVSFDKPHLSKKRRRSSQKASQHWDDPGCANEAMYYDENIIMDRPDAPVDAPHDDVVLDVEGDEESEESRQLTYDEIWDDSALINAWNAATEEYEAHHGGEKFWKKESITKSALWYNVPPSLSRKKLKVEAQSVDTVPKSTTRVGDTKNDGQNDSHPLNFDTFVPTYDPSLDLPVRPHHGGPLPSKEEAFTRALGAMYWGGYWTAVYHCQSNGETDVQSPTTDEDDTGVQEETLIR